MLLLVQSTNKAAKPRTVNLTILSNGVIHKIGRRKTAVARVYVSEGTGVITVNKKKILTSQQLLYSTK
jgi:ribosomal protein S9